MTTVRINATEHATAGEAVQFLDAAGHDRAIVLGGRYFTTTAAEFDRIEAAGFQPSTIHHHRDRLVTVPGRHG